MTIAEPRAGATSARFALWLLRAAYITVTLRPLAFTAWTCTAGMKGGMWGASTRGLRTHEAAGIVAYYRVHG